MPGPQIRTDIVEVYVFRRAGNKTTTAAGHLADIEFLQLHRTEAACVAPDTWQPVMGHIHEGETAAACALRELHEETGLAAGGSDGVSGGVSGAGRGVVGFWQIEQPNIYFLYTHDCMMLSPGFAVEVDPAATVRLNEEHDGHRWVRRDRVDLNFIWIGQRHAIAQIFRDILDPTSPIQARLRIV